MTARDRPEVTDFLAHPDGLHLYAIDRSRRESEGRSLVYRQRGRVLGYAFFGRGQNLVLVGDDPGFLTTLGAFAAGSERTWQLVLGPWSQVTDFLDIYRRKGTRKARLDRTQTFMVQRRESLTDLAEPALRAARAEDLDELAGASARMSAEDFDIDLSRIDREKVRAGLAPKVAAGQSYLIERDGRIVFKADVSLLCPEGAQVEGVFTAEGYRGQGIAKRAMTELGRRHLDQVPHLTLHVAADNTPACKAYEAAGYRRVTELRLAIFPFVS